MKNIKHFEKEDFMEALDAINFFDVEVAESEQISYINIMKISYAITVCNELEEVKRLVNFLLSNKRKEDDLVILYDIN